MSKNINVNSGHYKVAGRERQGEAIHQSSQKGAYAQQREEARREAVESQAGAPLWETTPPNLEIPDKPAPPARKQTRKRTAKRTQKPTAKRTRKTMPKKSAARSRAKKKMTR